MGIRIKTHGGTFDFVNGQGTMIDGNGSLHVLDGSGGTICSFPSPYHAEVCEIPDADKVKRHAMALTRLVNARADIDWGASEGLKQLKSALKQNFNAITGVWK